MLKIVEMKEANKELKTNMMELFEMIDFRKSVMLERLAISSDYGFSKELKLVNTSFFGMKEEGNQFRYYFQLTVGLTEMEEEDDGYKEYVNIRNEGLLQAIIDNDDVTFEIATVYKGDTKYVIEEDTMFRYIFEYNKLGADYVYIRPISK